MSARTHSRREGRSGKPGQKTGVMKLEKSSHTIEAHLDLAFLKPGELTRSIRVRYSISDDVYKPEHPIIQGVTACAADDKVTPCFLEAISDLVAGSPRRGRT